MLSGTRVDLTAVLVAARSLFHPGEGAAAAQSVAVDFGITAQA